MQSRKMMVAEFMGGDCARLAGNEQVTHLSFFESHTKSPPAYAGMQLALHQDMKRPLSLSDSGAARGLAPGPRESY